MCTGVINEARLSRVVIGAKDETRGACGSNLDILDKNIECQKGIIENECKNILQDFFKSLRKTKQ
jgi:tRNA(adenine34) deaminase